MAISTTVEPPGLKTIQPFVDQSTTSQNVVFSFWPFYQKDIGCVSKNGFSKAFLKSLVIKVVTDVESCRQLWKEFSPNISLFDSWEFRYSFFSAYPRTEPYFIVLAKNGDNQAVLPLWFDKSKQQYVWFGSSWQEDNRFLVKDPSLSSLIMHAAPKSTLLKNISYTEGQKNNFLNLEEDESKYVLNLAQVGTFDSYLASLKKKKRYNIRRDVKKIEALKPKIIFNRFKDLDLLVSLSDKRFKAKNEKSSWEDEGEKQCFVNVISNSGISYELKMISVEIKGKIAGVDLVAVYKDNYYPLICGYDTYNFPGIGSYLNVHEISDALYSGYRRIDFLAEDCNWKHSWFKPQKQYKISLT